jgi:hypothetical protein
VVLVALDIEQLLYEATTLLNAGSLINRIARQSYPLVPLGPKMQANARRDYNSSRAYAVVIVLKEQLSCSDLTGLGV